METNDQEPNENPPMLTAVLVIVSIVFAMLVVIATHLILHSKQTSNASNSPNPDVGSSTSSRIQKFRK